MNLGGPPREPPEALARPSGHQPDPHRHRQRPDGDAGRQAKGNRPGRFLAGAAAHRNRRSRSRSLSERAPIGGRTARRGTGVRAGSRARRGVRVRARSPARRPSAGADRARGGTPAARSGSCAREGVEGVALTFDDGPHPQGTPAVLEILRQARPDGDLLPRRRAGRAAPGAGGRDRRRRRPSGRAPLPSPPQPAAADPRVMLLDDAERGRAAIEEASGQAIADATGPRTESSAAPGWRAIRSRGWRPGALVALGSGLGRDGAPRSRSPIPQGDRWDRPRGHRPIARR